MRKQTHRFKSLLQLMQSVDRVVGVSNVVLVELVLTTGRA